MLRLELEIIWMFKNPCNDNLVGNMNDGTAV